jgi:hypothetical protein
LFLNKAIFHRIQYIRAEVALDHICAQGQKKNKNRVDQSGTLLHSTLSSSLLRNSGRKMLLIFLFIYLKNDSRSGGCCSYRDDLIVKCREMSLVLDPQLSNGRLPGRWPLTPQPASGGGGRHDDGVVAAAAAAGTHLLSSSSMMNFSRCYSQQAKWALFFFSLPLEFFNGLIESVL